jgi:hypothetical protein
VLRVPEIRYRAWPLAGHDQNTESVIWSQPRTTIRQVRS